MAGTCTQLPCHNPPIDYLQKVKDFLEEKFVFINDKEISTFNERKIQEKGVEVDINSIIQKSFSSYKFVAISKLFIFQRLV